jgi:hypothetical protein
MRCLQSHHADYLQEENMNTKARKILIAIGLGTLLTLGSAGAVAGSTGHVTAATATHFYI